MSRTELSPDYRRVRSDIATEFGLNCAFVLEQVRYFVNANKANGKHFYDGRYWAYHTRRAFTEYLPFFTERQVRTALDKLVEQDLILKGNYNSDPYDHTVCFALTDKAEALFDITPASQIVRTWESEVSDLEVRIRNKDIKSNNTPYQSVTSSAIGLSKADITPKQSPYTNINTKQAEEVTSCLSPKGERTRGATPEAIQKAYNEICKSLPKCKVLTEKRRKAIKARLAEGITEEDFTEIFRNAENSDFLKGGGKQGFVANFDFLIGDKAVKVLEGTYANADQIQAEACMRKYMLTDEEFNELFPLDEEDKNGSD